MDRFALNQGADPVLFAEAASSSASEGPEGYGIPTDRQKLGQDHGHPQNDNDGVPFAT